MTCKCDDHTQHGFRLGESERRHDDHDKTIVKIWEYFETKVSKGTMVFLFASIFISLIMQTSAYLLAQRTNKGVAVLTERVNNHLGYTKEKKVIEFDHKNNFPNPMVNTAHAATENSP